MSGNDTNDPPPPRGLSPATMRAINTAAERAANRAATRTVKQTLLALGIDASNEASMIEFQKDTAWIRRVRKSGQSLPGKLGLATFGAVLSLIGGLLILAVKYVFENHIWK